MVRDGGRAAHQPHRNVGGAGLSGAVESRALHHSDVEPTEGQGLRQRVCDSGNHRRQTAEIRHASRDPDANVERSRKVTPMLIAEFVQKLRDYPGIGQFLAWQIAADVKPFSALRNAPDYQTAAGSG